MSILIKTGGKIIKKIMENPKVRGTLILAADSAKDVVQKTVDRHNERVKSLVEVPNVTEVNVQKAKEHLENLGFMVHTILLRPHTKYRGYTPDRVLRMVPKSGKLKAGSIIKLYYLDEKAIQESQAVELIDVVGMPLQKAVEVFENVGLKVETEKVLPRKEYALKNVGHVLKMEPTPTLLNQHVLKSTVIKLKYMDEKAFEVSKAMLQDFHEKIAKRNEKIKETLSKPKKMVLEKVRSPIGRRKK